MQKLKRTISYMFILGGGILALYQQRQPEPNQYLVILGLALLMVGVYVTARRIPDKADNETAQKDSDEAV